MPLTRQEKEKVVEKLLDSLKRAKSAVFANFIGLKFKDSEKLRKSAKTDKSEVVVAKKTLLKVAFKKAGLDEVPVEQLEEGIATIFSYGDEIAGPKLVSGFAKENKALTLLSGLLLDRPVGQRFLNLEQVKALAAIPGKKELLAQLVGSINAPISGLVNVLAGNLRNLVNVLGAIKKSKS